MSSYGAAIFFLNKEYDKGELGGGFCVSYNRFNATKIAYTDSANVSLSGQSTFIHLMLETSHLKHFDFSPKIGVGYGKLMMNTGSGKQEKFSLASSPEKIFYHPAFLFDVSADTRLNFNFISIGAKGGYQADLSKKTWMSGNKVIEGGPKTSLSGFYWMATLSLFIRS